MVTLTENYLKLRHKRRFLVSVLIKTVCFSSRRERVLRVTPEHKNLEREAEEAIQVSLVFERRRYRPANCVLRKLDQKSVKKCKIKIKCRCSRPHSVDHRHDKNLRTKTYRINVFVDSSHKCTKR